MTDGTSQGLFIVVAIVIFGIFVVLANTLFGSEGLSNDLKNLFTNATEQANENLAVTELEVTVPFADENFEQVVKNQLIANGVITSNDEITKKDMLEITELKFGYAATPEEDEINSLDGIQYAKNITSLNVAHNNIDETTYLKDLKNLKTLILGGNPLDNEDIKLLANITSLRSLNVGTTGISDISVLKTLTNLITLQVDTNPITDISVINYMPKLKHLKANNMPISDIKPILNASSLEELDFRFNELTEEEQNAINNLEVKHLGL